MHPFLRLAKSYHTMFVSKEESGNELALTKSRVEKYIKGSDGKVSFEVSIFNYMW